MESTVGEHGGNISKNMLEINITPEDHGAIIICEAINDELQESTHNAQTLSVKCKNFFSVKLFLGCAGSVGRLETYFVIKKYFAHPMETERFFSLAFNPI